MAGNVPASRYEHAIKVIERNAVAQARLIDDWLDVSRIIAGNMRLHLTAVDLRSRHPRRGAHRLHERRRPQSGARGGLSDAPSQAGRSRRAGGRRREPRAHRPLAKVRNVPSTPVDCGSFLDLAKRRAASHSSGDLARIAPVEEQPRVVGDPLPRSVRAGLVEAIRRFPQVLHCMDEVADEGGHHPVASCGGLACGSTSLLPRAARATSSARSPTFPWRMSLSATTAHRPADRDQRHRRPGKSSGERSHRQPASAADATSFVARPEPRRLSP